MSAKSHNDMFAETIRLNSRSEDLVVVRPGHELDQINRDKLTNTVIVSLFGIAFFTGWVMALGASI